MAEDIKPKGRPKQNPKYTWQVTSEGIIPVEVRFHQGNYKTFKYENGKTTMLKTVNTPLFDSLEEANSNAPKFKGFTEDIKDTRGRPRQFQGKYGYEITPDNEIIVKEYRFFTGSGSAKEGYRSVSFDEKGATTKGKLFDGELFDTPDAAIDNYETNYSGGKKINWEAFEEAQADIAAREPSQSEIDKMNKGTLRDDPFSDIDVDEQARQAEQNRIEQIYEDTMADRAAREPSQAELDRYTRSLTQADDAQIEAYKDMMAGYTDEDITFVAKQKGVNPKTLGDVLGRLGAGALDPVSEALEVALGKIGLGKIAKGWVQGEVLNLLAGVLRGTAQGGAEYLTQTTGPAVLNLASGGKANIKGSPEPGIDAIIEGMAGFADQMEVSPSYQMDEALKKYTGKYGNEWLIEGAKRVKGIFNEG
jgi:hypothetical protein